MADLADDVVVHRCPQDTSGPEKKEPGLLSPYNYNVSYAELGVVIFWAELQNSGESYNRKGIMKGTLCAVLLLAFTATVRSDGLVAFINNNATAIKVKGFEEPDSLAVAAPAGSAIVEIVWAPSGTAMRAWTGRQKLSTWLTLNPGWQECLPSRTHIGPGAGRFNAGAVNIPTPVHGGAVDMLVVGWNSAFGSFDEACLAGQAVGFSAKFTVVTSNPYAVPPPVAAPITGVGQFSGVIMAPIVLEPENRPPVLAAIPDQNAAEEALLLVSVLATDPDAGQTLTFLLGPGAPPGAVLDPATGVFMWTPPEAAGPGVYPVSIIAVDDGVPALSSVQGFNVLVGEVNRAPAVAGPGSIATDEATGLSLQLAATDPDVPANNINFEKQSGPAGLTVSSSGVMAWTPAEADGPGAFEVVVRAFDNGVPSMSSTASLVVNVREVNSAPVLSPIADQVINESSTLNVLATATDADLPVNPLVFETVSGPPGLIVSPTGQISWTPNETNGPSVVSVSVRVSDSQSPALTATRSFNITVNEVNAAPTLAAIGDKTGDEETSIGFTASATDADTPAQVLTFSLAEGAPVGATISSAGIFEWTPTEAQGPGTYPVTVRVSDGQETVTQTIQITVSEANQPPVLAAIGNRTGEEETAISFAAAGTDADVPTQALTFSLAEGAPAGATISSAGVFDWTPTEDQDPGTYPVTVRVSDGQETVTQTIQITVSEANQPPILAAIGNRTGDEETAISFAAAATDADVPAQSLTFSLAADAPAGATISSAGVFEWTPTESQGPGAYPVTIRVSDGQETVTQTIQITVNEVNKPPVLAVIGDKTVDAGILLSFSASAVDEDRPAQTLVYSLGANAPAGASLSASGSFSWTPTTAQADATYPITVVVSDGIANASATFQVVVKAPLPLTIVSHPQDQMVDAGTDALFAVVASGESPISYQWRFNGAELPGETQSSLSIAAVQPSNVGSYDVLVRNTLASLTSSAAILAIKQDFGGSAIDGYIAGGTVFFDANFNGTRDGNEPSAQTDGQGRFQLTVNLSLFDTDGSGSLDPSEGRLVLTGGQDIATGLEHQTVLLAPPGSAVITPLTTLLQTMVEHEPDSQPDAVEASIKNAFGISHEVDLTNFDPLHETLSNAPGAVSVLKAGAQVQDTMVQVAALLGSASNSPPSSAAAGQAVMGVLGSMLLNEVPVELTSPTGVMQVITQALSVTGTQLPPGVAAGAASVISDLNQIKEAVDETPGNGADAARSLAQAQGIAQGVVRQTLEEVAQSLQAVDDLTSAFTGDNLVSTVGNASVGDLSGDETRVGQFSFTRESYRCREDGSAVPGFELAVTRTDGSKGSVTVMINLADGTARGDEEDFVPAPVAVTFGDGEITKLISLAEIISEDPVVEGEETILLSLSLAPGSPPSATTGGRTNATLAVADNDFPGSFAFAQGNYRLNEKQGGEVPVTVTRAGGVGGTVTVVVTPSPLEGASAGLDFDATPILLRFEPGNLNRTFTIPVLPDQLLEMQERFQLTLTLAPGAPAGAALGSLSQAEVLIDNDASRMPHATLGPGSSEGGLRRLRIAGTPGQKYVLESSPDLAHWTDHETGTLPQAPSEIAAPASGGVQFYRLRLVP